MAKTNKRKVLGRGLSVLLNDENIRRELDKDVGLSLWEFSCE